MAKQLISFADIVNRKSEGKFTMEIVHDVLAGDQKRNPRRTLCDGCPNRDGCEKGYTNGYVVHECTKPVAAEAALALCGHVLCHKPN